MTTYEDFIKDLERPTEKFVPGVEYPEEWYRDYTQSSIRLGIPATNTFLKIETETPDKEIITHYDGRSKTLNRNYWNHLTAVASMIGSPTGQTNFQLGYLSDRNNNGTITALSYMAQFMHQSYSWGTIAGIGQLQGIVVGTGTSAENYDGYSLQTQVAHGNSAGQLYYQALSITNTGSYSNLVWTFVCNRLLNNNSGGTIAVNEIGFFAYPPTSQVATLVLRDKLGSAVNVLNAGSLTVTYTFTVTVPNA